MGWSLFYDCGCDEPDRFVIGLNGFEALAYANVVFQNHDSLLLLRYDLTDCTGSVEDFANDFLARMN